MTTALLALVPVVLAAVAVAVAAWVHERRARMWLDVAADAERMLSAPRHVAEWTFLHRVVENSQRRAWKEADTARRLWLVLGIHRGIPDFPAERP